MTGSKDTLPGRRIKAAMALAGIAGVRELADLLDARGLSERSIRNLQISTAIEPGDWRYAKIAEECGLSPTFFEAALSDLGARDDDPPLGERLEALERRTAARLDRVEQLVEQLATSLDGALAAGEVRVVPQLRPPPDDVAGGSRRSDDRGPA